MKRIFLIILLTINSVPVYSRIHQFQSTRLKSTAGAGVASILMDESTILNPAPMAFIQTSSIYLHKSGGDIDTTSQDNTHAPKYKSDQLGVIISDSSNKICGSLSYFNQNEKHDSRKQFSFSMASTIGKTSAMGVSTKIIKDELSDDGINKRKDNRTQFVAGVTHVVNKNFTLGIIANDPLKKSNRDTYGMMGVQYIINDFFAIMYDVGADYSKNLSGGLIQRGAIQMKILSDFYLRAGAFDNKILSEKGNGIGIGWVQPKLVIDLAFLNTTVMENELLFQRNEKIKETSFSLSYKF